MNSTRSVFCTLLGAESGEQARQAFSPVALRALLHDGHVDQALTTDWHSPQALDVLAQETAARMHTLGRPWCALRERLDADQLAALRAKAVREAAPLLVGSQHVLHSVCASWNNEASYAMAVLRIHAADVGEGLAGAGRLARYAELLRELGPSESGIDPLRIGEDQSLSPGAFNLAAMLVVMGHFPESLLPQILGVNLFLRHAGLLPMFAFLSQPAPAMSFLDLRQHPSQPGLDLGMLAGSAVCEYLAQADASAAESVAQGYAWARCQVETAHRALLDVLERWVDPREAVRDVIRRRRPEACQYHDSTRLAGVPMQPLLQSDDALRLLEHLANSAYVRPGDPQRSPLLNALISPRGKMFRIFSPDDVMTLQRWIAGLPYAQAPSPEPAYLCWKDDGQLQRARCIEERGSVLSTAVPTRQRYTRWLRVELTPAEEQQARDYVNRWLVKSARALRKGRCPLPERWAPGVLRQWLQQQHEAANATLDPDEAVPTREEVVADILALAPLTMIDGAWLAGFAHPSLASSGFASRLFETYYDELGNGVTAQNHPVIYRQLLRAVHGELPPTASAGYADADCFAEQDFDLPLLWLAIGRYPQRYCAEILGLNLAMELSGVGGGYRRTHKALRAYGYPTLFVDLHNAIDNVATGHSAWAVASLDTYLSAFGATDRDALWTRVRIGFAALNPPREDTMLDKFKERMRSLL
ncbi:iron-containing redox enzyme family protein [Pseudomonas sp. S75]|uniref:iron-containing redox enzyme family protein n=1 Tax=unclassified Pseudomonas TaxID=196821 RepID=UPI001904E4F3|nr:MULTISPECIES: iron-containing redox enzyme family protein [unclassified Pseudomonas]MBJ9977535.1 iron-containing redox enzyme family protein [Pseudomonas sp. S30]MBK0155198.1 iron-containing redox enzyme family protein [Pseudomonas sp. S75]